MERQRQNEWENQRIQEMQSQKQKEQEKLLKLKAQNQNLNIELSTLNEKIKELSQKICDTRSGVTNVKTVIDGMRSTRDTQNSEMAQLKSRIKEQNQKLVQLSQEKTKIDAKTKNDSVNQDNAAFSNKQLIIKQLRDKLENTKEQIIDKNSDIETNDKQANDIKLQLTELINSCEELYGIYEVQRTQVLEMKNNRRNDSYTTSWDTNTTNTDAWGPEETTSPIKSTSGYTTNVAAPLSATGSYIKYRALYEFVQRNEDEISFQPGDIIMVPTDLNMEPGWLAGEVNGKSGYFPETYVELYDESTLNDNNQQIENVVQETIETAAPPIQNDNLENYNGNLEYFVSCYPYESGEAGDLTFSVGESILVSKKDGDWWTGTIGNRTGIFPSNYVTVPETTIPTAAAAAITTTSSSSAFGSINATTPTTREETKTINGNNAISPVKPTSLSGTYEEEASNQADADSEVSQINTQPIMSESSQGSFSRPMSTTSTTRGKKPEIAQVIAPYEASSAEQLSLTRGQLIMIRKKTDSGWWEGELQAKGRRRQIGWFPATYVKVLQGGRNSGRNTPVSGGRIEMSEQVLGEFYLYVCL